MPDAPRLLLIKGKGGFGNRMLSAVSGILFAEATGRVPVIDWRDGVYAPAGQNAYRLFFDAPASPNPESPNPQRPDPESDGPECPDPASLEGIDDVTPAIWRGNLGRAPVEMIERFAGGRHSDPLVYRRFCCALHRADAPERLAVYWSYLPKMRAVRRVRRAHPTLGQASDDAAARDVIARHFRPQPRILAAVDRLVGDAGPQTLGVHVRHSDRRIPVERIEAAVERLRHRHGFTRLLLATDSAMVEARFRDRFPGVFSHPKWFPPDGGSMHQNRANPDLVRESDNALVDMWALGRCGGLVYSGHSTFALVSRLLGAPAPACCIDVDRFNPVVRAKRILNALV